MPRLDRQNFMAEFNKNYKQPSKQIRFEQSPYTVYGMSFQPIQELADNNCLLHAVKRQVPSARTLTVTDLRALLISEMSKPELKPLSSLYGDSGNFSLRIRELENGAQCNTWDIAILSNYFQVDIIALSPKLSRICFSSKVLATVNMAVSAAISSSPVFVYHHVYNDPLASPSSDSDLNHYLSLAPLAVDQFKAQSINFRAAHAAPALGMQHGLNLFLPTSSNSGNDKMLNFIYMKNSSIRICRCEATRFSIIA